MNRAIFYRHWLEIRGGLAVTGVATALIAAIGFLVVTTSSGSGPETYSLGTLAWTTAVAGLVAAIVVTGSGIRTNAFQPGHPSFQYTLTLPVHRTSWIFTRFLTGLAGTIAPAAVIFIVHAAALLASGNGVPLPAMARTSGAILLAAIVAGTAVGVVFPIWRDWLQPVGASFVFTAFVLLASNALNDYSPNPGWPRPVQTLVESPPDLGTLAVATLLIVAGLIWVAIVAAHKQDF